MKEKKIARKKLSMIVMAKKRKKLSSSDGLLDGGEVLEEVERQWERFGDFWRGKPQRNSRWNLVGLLEVIWGIFKS
jgi:hypothetical protein